MKKLLLLLLFSFCSHVSAQTPLGSAKFTWIIPNPAFNAPVPSDWVIDEYRIYCTVDQGDGSPKIVYNKVVYGYTTAAASYDDVPGGELFCYMTSWSIKADAESEPSNTVSKFVLTTIPPGPPTDFDFEVDDPTASVETPPPVVRDDSGRKIRHSRHQFNRRLPNPDK